MSAKNLIMSMVERQRRKRDLRQLDEMIKELLKMTPKEIKERFPDLLTLLDASNWEQFKPEIFLENRFSST